MGFICQLGPGLTNSHCVRVCCCPVLASPAFPYTLNVLCRWGCFPSQLYEFAFSVVQPLLVIVTILVSFWPRDRLDITALPAMFAEDSTEWSPEEAYGSSETNVGHVFYMQ